VPSSLAAESLAHLRQSSCASAEFRWISLKGMVNGEPTVPASRSMVPRFERLRHWVSSKTSWIGAGAATGVTMHPERRRIREDPDSPDRRSYNTGRRRDPAPGACANPVTCDADLRNARPTGCHLRIDRQSRGRCPCGVQRRFVGVVRSCHWRGWAVLKRTRGSW
jgi:hypothetical protein